MGTGIQESLWNTVNLAFLTGINDYQRQEIENTFGWNAATFPLGLVPGANELLSTFNKGPVFKTLEDMEENNWLAPIDREELPALSKNSPAQSSAQTVAGALHERINRGAPTLLRTPTQYSAFSFLDKLFKTYPLQNIVAVTESAIGQNPESLGIQLAKKCREFGHDASWISKEESDRTRRIRICELKKLTLNSMKVWGADIFVCLDPIGFVNRRFGGEGSPYAHWDFFGNYGTGLKPGCRIIGLLQRNYSQPKNLMKVWETFGIDELSINSNHEVHECPRVKFVTRSKADSFNIQIKSDSSLVDHKRMMFWNNVARNRFIVRVAKKTFAEEGGDNSAKYATSSLSSGASVAVVVENETHQLAMKAALGNASDYIPVYSFADIKNPATALPKALIRADGGTGLLPIAIPVSGLTVIDVKDEGTWVARKAFKMRKREYALHWNLGDRPNLARWQAARSSKRG